MHRHWFKSSSIGLGLLELLEKLGRQKRVATVERLEWPEQLGVSRGL